MSKQGSIWRKWDLHVHTPASVLNNGFGSNWDVYVQKLFKTLIEKEIAVVGITDYFNIDGYKKIKEDYLGNQTKLQELFTAGEIIKINEMLVLPNIEFRSNVFVGQNSINFHVLFSEEITIKDIEEKFLHEIDFRYEADPQLADKMRKLKEANLIELGQRLKFEHTQFASDSDIFVGMMNAVVDDSQVTGVLTSKESIFGGKYVFVVMADEDLSAIDWNSRDHQTRKVLTQKSDLLFSSIKETEFDLNSSLVSVTGGKGSGKTAFVDLIASCYKDRCHTKDKNSFVGRIADSSPNIEITLTFGDGSIFSKKVTENKFFENSEIVYIAQGELETYIGDNSDLDNYINRLIFESSLINNTVKSFEFNQIQASIDLDKKSLESKNALISKLEGGTDEAAIQAVSIEKKQLEADKKDIIARISDSAKKQTGANNLIAQQSQLAISKLKEQKDSLLNIQEYIGEAVLFIENDIVAFNLKVGFINGFLVKLGKDVKVDLITYPTLENLKTLNTQIQAQLNQVVQCIEKSQKEIDNLASGVKDHAKLLDKQKDIDQALSKTEKKEDNLKKNQDLLVVELTNRNNLFKQLLKNTLLLKQKYEEIIALFSENKDVVLSDLSFGVKINYNQSEFLEGVEDVLDQRRKGAKASDAALIFADLFTAVNNFVGGDETKIEPLFSEISKIEKENKDKIRNSQAISKTDFYNLLYKSYFNVVPLVKYKKTQLHKLSLGQKATVLIKIYLAQGDKPIIIDSHDDHLDNEFIMDELVKALRQAKQYRQVILASNNGNVVINSDSEQIIIATRNDGEILYNAGSIENPQIYTHAVKVLEGGQEAFKQRQQKYRILNKL